jgi:hypothetical protein
MEEDVSEWSAGSGPREKAVWTRPSPFNKRNLVNAIAQILNATSAIK